MHGPDAKWRRRSWKRQVHHLEKLRKLSYEENSDGNKAALCASSKRKLDAYRSRPLEPKEGELVNENNEMFEEILQSKFDRPKKV